jgi:hypothetical protein
VATMGGDQIYVFAQVGSSGGGTVLGRLMPRRIDYENAPRIGLKMTIDFVPDRGAPQFSWISLDGSLASQTTLEQALGRLDVPGRSRPLLDPPGDQGVEWLWLILPDDLQVIERTRGLDRRVPVRFRLRIQGIGQMAGSVVGVVGEGTVEVAASDWDGLMVAYGFEPPSVSAQMIEGIAPLHPSWADARRRIAPARDQLRRGEGYAALRSCLGEFENLVSPAYSKTAWIEQLAHLDPQKADGVALAISGHVSLLNKVGHHRSRASDDAGDHPLMPLDQWEAELAVANSELLLAMAIRLLESRNGQA